MNIKRLEMTKLMLQRMIVGSWVGVTQLQQKESNSYTQPTTVDVKTFDIRSWRGNIGRDQNNVCGYSACVIGHACFDEEFRKLGWSWDGDQPKFGDKIAWDAVNKFYGFTETDGKVSVDELLFLDEGYATYDTSTKEWNDSKVTPQHVIDRIDELIKLGEKKFLKKYTKVARYIAGE